jgi:hypothetical protein
MMPMAQLHAIGAPLIDPPLMLDATNLEDSLLFNHCR